MNELIKVIIAKAKLDGTESEDTICSMLASHHALRSNGFIRNAVTCDSDGKPEYITSIWQQSESEKNTSQKLPRGQRYAYILKSELDEAINGDF
ncbi:hypothetical protein [Photobacterium damselae]|uniref:hypothetical protein n=1 Tax=Photobacterium damselae TaxID=38293 RepID=UPI0040688B98